MAAIRAGRVSAGVAGAQMALSGMSLPSVRLPVPAGGVAAAAG